MNDIDVEARMEKARQLHKQGCNCCQSVVLAYSDRLPISEENATRMAAPFGRGISGLKEVCGCVSGMAMVCGLTDRTSLAKPLIERYREDNGEIVCARLLAQGASRGSCNDLVASAARILGEGLKAEE